MINTLITSGTSEHGYAILLPRPKGSFTASALGSELGMNANANATRGHSQTSAQVS